MLLSQIVIGVALVGMALVEPREGVLMLGGVALDHLVVFGAMALVVAFASATQDIVIDAWRIESASNDEEQALLTATATLGYRGALLVTDALILIVAARAGWVLSYEAMALLMGVGVAATFLATEPAAARAASPPITSVRGLYDAILGPFVSFFREHGRWALLMLTAIALYRLPDFIMGPMANPFYADLAIGKETVGAVRGSIGLAATITGVAAAGLMAVRFGFTRTLLLGAVLGPGSNLAFTYLAWHGGDPGVFSAVMAIDNFCNGFAGVALVGYMSSLTSLGYTATQYALLSSFYALPGKMLKGLSGVAVEWFTALSGGLLDGYAWFFLATAVAGVPAFLLCLWLVRQAPAHAARGRALPAGPGGR